MIQGGWTLIRTRSSPSPTLVNLLQPPPVVRPTRSLNLLRCDGPDRTCACAASVARDVPSALLETPAFSQRGQCISCTEIYVSRNQFPGPSCACRAALDSQTQHCAGCEENVPDVSSQAQCCFTDEDLTKGCSRSTVWIWQRLIYKELESLAKTQTSDGRDLCETGLCPACRDLRDVKWTCLSRRPNVRPGYVHHLHSPVLRGQRE